MKKVGHSFLQVKLVLDKGVGTEEVFMGKSGIVASPPHVFLLLLLLKSWGVDSNTMRRLFNSQLKYNGTL